MTAKLILSMDGRVLREYLLDRPRMTIGRKPGNDIVIDNLAVSGEHAALLAEGENFRLRDLGSTNGLTVNGAAQTDCLLCNNDLIVIGKYRLKFIQIGAGADDLEKTMLIRTPPRPATPPAESVASLKVLTGTNAGQVLVLSKPETSLGKAGQQVALISRHPAGYKVSQREGVEPLRLNGAAIRAGETPLRAGDRLEVAGVEMLFQQD
jgi:pSer/pThr/pTyr-binding forkhead associated (FHA) protein